MTYYKPEGIFVSEVIASSKINPDYRMGQALFNLLPGSVGNAVAGRMFDPFHTESMSVHDVQSWVEDHLIFDNEGRIIALFNADKFLWTRDHD